MSLRKLIRGVQVAVRASVAAGISLALSAALDLEYPLYAFLAAVIVTDLSPVQTRKLGIQRMVATLVGATCGATLSMIMPPRSWTIALGILTAMLTCNLMRVQEGAKVAGYISGIVMLAFSVEPWSYALHRFLETTLGIGVAGVISLEPKLIRIEESERPGS